MKNSSLIKISLLNSVGVLVYVSLVALIMQNGEKIFGKMQNYLGPIAFLLLFILSAGVTGALVLGRPILFYLDGKKVEAIKLFGFTLAWLFVLTVLALVINIIINIIMK